eukprot:TRINITY_DN4510_c0_g1_i2.p1 TRINITY_DN4510_c0_g1~~TRINITY_DN4510_c0_g1_i2.p1  ORF type:complete len:447 (-),score=101.96 TRINITY_DN4510_c0_g1_i2:182-1522(-)
MSSDKSNAMDAQTLEQVQLMRRFLERCHDGDLAGFDQVVQAIGASEAETETETETETENSTENVTDSATREKDHPVLTLLDPHGRNGLHLAASRGHLIVCQRLLNLSRDPQSLLARKDNAGNTPLHHAALAGHDLVCDYLLRVRPELASASTDSGTAYHHAVASSNAKIVRLLQARGADPNHVDSQGIPPLFMAVVQGDNAVSSALLEAGARHDFETPDGLTVAHVAAELGHFELLKCIVSAGADVNKRSRDNQRPIDLATSVDVVEYLYPKTSLHAHETLAFFLKKCTQKAKDSNAAAPQSPVAPKIDPITLEKAQKLREQGNNEFRSGNFEKAAILYGEAIELDSFTHTLFSNRSACYLKLGQADKALDDANAARSLNPSDPKACFRAGCALMELKQYEEAAVAFFDGVKLNPDSMELAASFQDAIKKAKQDYQEKQAQSSQKQ